MSARYPPLEVRVWGDFACFTRPEMKVERVSYPVPTASAMRGVLESIFWKPEFHWHIEEIWVLKSIRYFSILRNEVNSKMSERSARSWMKNGGGYDATKDRAQRHTLALRNVDYLIRARIELHPEVADNVGKYLDQFRRRVTGGRCFSRPYLGCREFAANFSLPTGDERPFDRTEDLGLMLLDLTYSNDGLAKPQFWDAKLEKGVIRPPSAPRWVAQKGEK